MKKKFFRLLSFISLFSLCICYIPSVITFANVSTNGTKYSFGVFKDGEVTQSEFYNAAYHNAVLNSAYDSLLEYFEDLNLDSHNLSYADFATLMYKAFTTQGNVNLLSHLCVSNNYLVNVWVEPLEGDTYQLFFVFQPNNGALGILKAPSDNSPVYKISGSEYPYIFNSTVIFSDLIIDSDPLEFGPTLYSSYNSTGSGWNWSIPSSALNGFNYGHDLFYMTISLTYLSDVSEWRINPFYSKYKVYNNIGTLLYSDFNGLHFTKFQHPLSISYPQFEFYNDSLQGNINYVSYRENGNDGYFGRLREQYFSYPNISINYNTEYVVSDFEYTALYPTPTPIPTALPTITPTPLPLAYDSHIDGMSNGQVMGFLDTMSENLSNLSSKFVGVNFITTTIGYLYHYCPALSFLLAVPIIAFLAFLIGRSKS